MRNSHERSEKYWQKRTQDSLTRLEKLLNELKTTTDLVKKKPHDVVFLPLSLLLDIIEKEHKAVENMINLNKIEDTAAEERKLKRKEVKAKEQAALEKSDTDLERLQQKYLNVELTPSMIKEIEQGFNTKERKTNGRAKRSKNDSMSSTTSRSYIADSSDESEVDETDTDETAYPHLYVPESISNQEMPLCIHGKVNLMNVLHGEIKAVKKTGAEKLLKQYGLYVRQKVYNHIDGGIPSYSQSNLVTGLDLCIECAQDLRQEAVFSGSLDNIEPMLNDILKDPVRQIIKDYVGTSSDYIVSRKDLTNHRNLALQQREYKKLVHQESDFTTIVFSTSNDTSNGDTKVHSDLGSPKSRKRKLSSDEEHPVKYKVEYTDPSSPLKLKFRREPPMNGNTKMNGVVNGKIRNAPVASSEESASETDDEELESEESDPDWNGQETGFSGRRKNRGTGTPKKKKKSTKSANASDQETEVMIPKQPVYFNHEIVCPHGNVRNGMKLVRLDRHEWLKIIVPFFDNPALLKGDQIECFDCEQEKYNEQLSNKQNKEILTKINQDIAIILKDIERRKWSRDDLGLRFTNIICGKFLDNFRTAAKSRSASVNVPSLCQGCLICDHNKPFVDFNRSQIVGNAQPITSKEWKEIYKSYKTNYPEHNGDLVEIKLSNTG